MKLAERAVEEDGGDECEHSVNDNSNSRERSLEDEGNDGVAWNTKVAVLRMRKKEGTNEGDEGEASETKDVVESEHRHVASMTFEADDAALCRRGACCSKGEEYVSHPDVILTRRRMYERGV